MPQHQFEDAMSDDESNTPEPEPEPAPTAAQKAQMVLSLHWRYDPDGGAAATQYDSGKGFQTALTAAKALWKRVFYDTPDMLFENINYGKHTDVCYLRFFTPPQMAVCVGAIPGYMHNEAVCAAAVRIVDARCILADKSATVIHAAEITWVGARVKRQGFGAALMRHVMQAVGDRVQVFVLKVDAIPGDGQTQAGVKAFYEGVGFREVKCLCDKCRMTRMLSTRTRNPDVEYPHIQMVAGPASARGDIVLSTDVTFEIGVRNAYEDEYESIGAAICVWEKGFGVRVINHFSDLVSGVTQWAK
jgi:GNAT superfamily N-acetyltransferase